MFFAKNNRIYIKNNKGQYVFDTDYKMPAIIQKISGSITIPERNPNNGFGSEVYNLGSVSNNPEFLFVTCKFYTGKTWLNTYFNGTGSIIANYGIFAGQNSSWYSKFALIQVITFRINGTSLELFEEYYDDSIDYFDPKLEELSIDYTCYIGRFY